MSHEKSLPVATRFLSISQACKYLGISRMTLLQAEEHQFLRSIRTPGGHRRYNYDDLVRYLAAYGAPDAEGTEEKLPVAIETSGETGPLERFISLENALRQIILLLQVEMGGVFLFNETRRRLILSTSFGIPRWLLNKETVIGLEGVSGKALTELDPVVFTFIESELPLAEAVRGQGICVPLLAAQEKLGTLQIFSTQRHNFFPSEINILKTFASFFSMLLVSKWINKGQE